ncbi:MAG: hypothetical protein ABIJ96_01275 [Elusimicrobiota bacterium]
MPLALIALLLFAPPLRAEKAVPDLAAFVERFLEVETPALPAELIPKFMAVDASRLPRHLRARCRARQDELDALRRAADGKRRPPIRRAGLEPILECEQKRETEDYVGLLMGIGFFEVFEDEAQWLMKKTKCTECELIEQTSFTVIYQQPKKKKDRERKRYFMMPKDPFEALIGQYRKMGKTKEGTSFFGTGFFGACH